MIPRNAERADYHELLLVSSVSTVVVVRVGLHLTGYPQLGGGSLHIAHLLWGGLAMLASVLLLLTYLSRLIMRIAAVLGGVGFGLFVDELGKFVTADNNYFWRPALSLIYVCFVLLYLMRRAVRGRTEPDETETIINEALDRNDRHGDRYQRARRRTSTLLRTGWLTLVVTLVFLVQALAYIVALVLMIIFEASGTPKEVSPVRSAEVPIVSAALVATACYSTLVVVGATRILRHRTAALLWFYRATLLNLLLIQPFHFYRDQISALVGLGLNLGAFLVLSSALQTAPTANTRAVARQLPG